jgi:hypothetical protein
VAQQVDDEVVLLAKLVRLPERDDGVILECRQQRRLGGDGIRRRCRASRHGGRREAGGSRGQQDRDDLGQTA